ncbi:MAG: hypothetical protein WC756_15525 [Taibaiella sp.]|jgi:hypothetical protein
MKLTIPIITSLVLLPCIAQAQKSNPFASIGKKAEVHTLSNGRYTETYDDDVLQRVGTVVIDRRTKKIVRLLDSDSVNAELSDNSTASRWYSIDPLAAKYPSMSPYVFCANNPIRFVDPDGREIQLPGDKKAQTAYVQMLHASTGNNYSIGANNTLTLVGADPSFKGAKSASLAGVIDKGIGSKSVYSLSLVGGSKDDKGVFIDSYEGKKIDVSDLATMGKASTALQGAAIGHFLNEVQETGNFDVAHKASLGVEGKIYGELVGDASITGRKDRPIGGATNGFQTVEFEYNSSNKYELQQGATSKEVDGFYELGGVKIPSKTITTENTGELKSVKKVP